MGIYREKLVRELKKTSLSARTHQSYTRECRRFFERFPGVHPEEVSEEQVTDWLLELKEREYAPSSITMAKCGLQFFFTHVVRHDDWRIFREFKSGKKNGRRPGLSVREVWSVLDRVRTPHNRAALVTIYLCGLRISECVSLQVGDVHSDDGKLHVHRGKGAKSRYVPLPQKALELLREHWRRHRNPVMLFPARSRGECRVKIQAATKPMPLVSIQTVFKKATQEAGIHKRGLSVHSLRHSYATHLLELGVPTEHVRIFMGHAHLSTTEKYIHVTPTGIKETQVKIEKLAEPYHEL